MTARRSTRTTAAPPSPRPGQNASPARGLHCHQAGRRHPRDAEVAGASRDRRSRRRRRRGRRAAGHRRWLYAAPTAVFVRVLFVLPLLLVLRMSLLGLAAARRRPGLQLPGQLHGPSTTRFFADSVVFTLKYTVVATVLLIGLALGLALLVQESAAGTGCLRTAFFLPERARAGLGVPAVLRPLTATRPGPRPLRTQLGDDRFVPRHARRGAVVDALPDRVAVRRLLHAAHAGRPAGDPAELYEAARIDGAPAGRPSGGSPCRCCARPSR